MREANKPKRVEEEIVFDASQASAKNPRLFSSVNVKHISELDLTKLDENLVDGEHFLVNQKPSNELKAGIEEINDFDHESIQVKEPVQTKVVVGKKKKYAKRIVYKPNLKKQAQVKQKMKE